MKSLRISRSAPPSLLLAAAVFLTNATHAQQTRPPGRLVTDKEIVFLYFPELISAPRVNRIWFSPDEKQILLERWKGQAPVGEIKDFTPPAGFPTPVISLVLWDSRSRQAREVWSSPSDQSDINRVEWLPASGLALVRVSQLAPVKMPVSQDRPEEPRTVQSQLLLKVSPEAGPAQVITQTHSEGYSALEYGVSPVLPLAVALVDQKIPTLPSALPAHAPTEESQAVEVERKVLYLMDGTGRLGQSQMLPENFMFISLNWSPEGNPLVKGTEYIPGNPPAEAWYTVDPRTAELKRPEGKPALYEEKSVGPKPPLVSSSPLRVKSSSIAVKEGEVSLDLSALWLEHPSGGPRSKALICSDCSEGRLLSGGNLVVYRSQESVWAAPIMRMSLVNAQVAMRQTEKRIALQNAQSIGEALKDYARDHEGEFPPPDKILDVLYTPIDRDPSAFHKDLVYTFPGGKIPEGKKRDEVEIGYYRSPAGRAIIFADGHVEWKE